MDEVDCVIRQTVGQMQFENTNENEQKRLHIAFNIIHQAKA
jgi:hypothetical protein